MNYYRIYDKENHGYIVVKARSKKKALEIGKKYNIGTQEAIQTTVWDYIRNIFKVN